MSVKLYDLQFKVEYTVSDRSVFVRVFNFRQILGIDVMLIMGTYCNLLRLLKLILRLFAGAASV